MGYTHYWERPRVLPRQEFARASADCRRLCQALQIPLGHADGLGEPTFNFACICFNGHKSSGRQMSIQQALGLVWPQPQAHGVAMIGEGDAVTGSWGAGPAVTARVLGPDGDGSYEPFQVDRIEPPRDPRDEPADGWCFDFCKTNFRPYDLCVQGCAESSPGIEKLPRQQRWRQP